MSNTIHYLPAAIIVLLLVVVAMLAWMLVQAIHKQHVLEEKIESLLAQTEKKDRMIEVVAATAEREKECEPVNVPNNTEDEGIIEAMDMVNGIQLTDNAFVAYVDQLIARNIGKSDFNIPMVQKIMNLSRTQLDRRIKKLTGKTPTAYLLDRRMIYARELLLTTEMPIADVAMACGFEDTSYFTRVFHAQHGTTPSGMRGER